MKKLLLLTTLVIGFTCALSLTAFASSNEFYETSRDTLRHRGSPSAAAIDSSEHKGMDNDEAFARAMQEKADLETAQHLQESLSYVVNPKKTRIADLEKEIERLTAAFKDARGVANISVGVAIFFMFVAYISLIFIK